MRQNGFSYVEILISLFLFLMTLLLIGRIDMTSLHLIAKGKLNQQAALLLLEKLEELKTTPIEQLTAGEFEESSGVFLIRWRIRDHTPYFGTKQIQCRILYSPAAATIVESLFYRSE
jgi:Tfp pilus assembly protein PilV